MYYIIVVPMPMLMAKALLRSFRHTAYKQRTEPAFKHRTATCSSFTSQEPLTWIVLVHQSDSYVKQLKVACESVAFRTVG